MGRTLLRSLKIAIPILLICISLVLFIPLESRGLTRLILLPAAKRLHGNIDFSRSRVVLARSLHLQEVLGKDEKGRLYFCRAVDITYNIFNGPTVAFEVDSLKFYREMALLNSVTDMLSINRLPDIEFEHVMGTVQFKKGGIYIKKLYASNVFLRIYTNGIVDSGGSLDCDVRFSFSPGLTDKVPAVIRKTLLKQEEDGWASISFKAYGNYKKPSLHLSGERLIMNIIEGIGRE